MFNVYGVFQMIVVNNSNYYIVSEAAEVLKCHPATLSRWLKNGQIEARKLGKSWIISEQAIADFLNKVENKPPRKKGK